MWPPCGDAIEKFILFCARAGPEAGPNIINTRLETPILKPKVAVNQAIG
jgi:hypothetical protein